MLVKLGKHRFSIAHVTVFDRPNRTILFTDDAEILLDDAEADAFEAFWDENSTKILLRTDTPTTGVADEPTREFTLGDG